jgi:hypothetical protein
MNLNFSVIQDIEIKYDSEYHLEKNDNSNLTQKFSIETETGYIYNYKYMLSNTTLPYFDNSIQKCSFQYNTYVVKNFCLPKELEFLKDKIIYDHDALCTKCNFSYGLIPLNAEITYYYEDLNSYEMKGIFLEFKINQKKKTKKLYKKQQKLIQKKIDNEIESIHLIHRLREKLNIELKAKAYQKLELQFIKKTKMSFDIYKNVFGEFAQRLYYV